MEIIIGTFLLAGIIIVTFSLYYIRKISHTYFRSEQHIEHHMEEDTGPNRKLSLDGTKDFPSLETAKILILMQSGCSHCKENFEMIWDYFYKKHAEKIQLMIPNDDEDMLNFLDLYDAEFNISYYNDQFVDKNKIQTFPSFILADPNQNILMNTYNPFYFFNRIPN